MAGESLQTYQEVLKYLHEKKRTKHLLLGNGFSMSYDKDIFSYNALAKFIERVGSDTMQKIFKIANTTNFEIIMRQLDSFQELAEVFGAPPSVTNRVKDVSEELKSSLIDAIKEMHPEHVFTIPENKSHNCAMFLNAYLEEGG